MIDQKFAMQVKGVYPFAPQGGDDTTPGGFYILGIIQFTEIDWLLSVGFGKFEKKVKALLDGTSPIERDIRLMYQRETLDFTMEGMTKPEQAFLSEIIAQPVRGGIYTVKVKIKVPRVATFNCAPICRTLNREVETKLMRTKIAFELAFPAEKKAKRKFNLDEEEAPVGTAAQPLTTAVPKPGDKKKKK